ncbi:hypothetical protein FOL46_003263 [Perkinsus olseni]|uniref:Uncharacterized protein n=1 Tax=Perkinsus olseni TaxID=32597 RepID=A0A7J6M3M1_PEROL|nr:hypothetical protein FOL46_003263 [Perkinsus olseni]
MTLPATEILPTASELAERIMLPGAGGRRTGAAYEELRRLPTSLLRETLEILVHYNYVSDNVLIQCMGQDLFSLNLTGAYNLRKSLLAYIPRECPNLRVLNLSHCRQVNNRLVSAILVSCRYLQTLILEGCVRISDSAFVADGGQPQLGLARLQELSVGGCGQLSAFALQRVTDVAKKTLVKLDVSQTGAKSPCFDKLITRCLGRGLTYLDCSGTAVSDQAFTAPDLSLLSVEQIMIGACSKVTDAGVAALASKSPELMSFSSKWCAQLGDESVMALSKHCPGLKRLDLGNSKVTERGLLDLPAGLEVLSLEWCLHVDKGCVEKLRYLKNLKELNLSNCLCFAKPQNVATSKELCEVLKVNPNMEKLQLAGLESCGTEETLLVIRDYLPMLKVLDIVLTPSEGVSPDDNDDEDLSIVEAMQSLAESATLLTSLTLDLTRLPEKTASDVIMASLGLPNFPALRSISLTVESLSQAALETVLADRCTLDSIEIRGACPGLNDLALQKWLCGYMPSDVPLLDQALRGTPVDDGDPQRLDGHNHGSSMMPTSAHGTVRSQSNCVGLSDSDATVVRFSGNKLLPKKVYFVSSSSSEAEAGPRYQRSSKMHNNSAYRKLPFPLLFDEHAQALQRVRRLIVTDGLSGLTDRGVYMLSRILTYVQQLELLGCDGVSEESAEVLKRRCRALKTLHITDANQQLIVKCSVNFLHNNGSSSAFTRRAA